MQTDVVTLWSWPDGWRMVRPTTDAALCTLMERLGGEGRYSGSSDRMAEWLKYASDGRWGACFFLRPIPFPVGRPELGPSESVAGCLRFHVMADGLLSPEMSPGLYQPLVVDILRHVYDVILFLEPVTSIGPPPVALGSTKLDTSTYMADPKWAVENIGQPTLLDPRSENRQWFVNDVARACQGQGRGDSRGIRAEGTFSVQWPNDAVDDDISTVVLIEDREARWGASFHTAHRPNKFSIIVSVPAAYGDWIPLDDGRALDLRPLDPERSDNVRVFAIEGDPNPLFEDGATYLPWTVRIPLWSEEASGFVLEDVLVEVGVIGRTVADIRRVFRRRSVEGTPHSSFTVAVVLGVPPEMLVAATKELPRLVAEYGT